MSCHSENLKWPAGLSFALIAKMENSFKTEIQITCIFINEILYIHKRLIGIMFCIKEYIFDASLFNDNGIHSRYSPQLFIKKKKNWKHKVLIMYDFYLTKEIHFRVNFNFILFDCRFSNTTCWPSSIYSKIYKCVNGSLVIFKRSFWN